MEDELGRPIFMEDEKLKAIKKRTIRIYKL